MQMKNIKNYIGIILAVLYAFFLIVFVKDVCAAVLNSVKVCVEVMIPSLYAFMVISGFIVSSNIYAVLSKPFGLISRYVFRIPEEYFSVFLIGSVGGYPVGARLLADMTEEGKISKEDAEHMLSYCYLAGPAFICGIAGVKLFSSVQVGMIIFATVIGANIIIGILTGLGRKVPPKSRKKIDLDISLDCLIKSVYSGAKGMFSICAIIVFFSSIICIFEKLGAINYSAEIVSKVSGLSFSDSIAAVKAVIEISNISGLTPNNYRLIPLAAALLSFGGVCVLIQVSGFVGNKLSTKHFYFSRIIATIISYFLCKMLIVVFNAEAIYVIAPKGLAHRQNSLIPVLFLLIMTILLLSNIFIEKNKEI